MKVVATFTHSIRRLGSQGGEIKEGQVRDVEPDSKGRFTTHADSQKLSDGPVDGVLGRGWKRVE